MALTIEEKIDKLEKKIERLEKAIVEILERLNDRYDQDAYKVCWKIEKDVNS